MIKITNIQVYRYRSILSLDLPIDDTNNLIAICGQNNVDKTNLLRAIQPFFHPQIFEPSLDIPKIKNATGGQSVYPKIVITFFDDTKKEYIEITRDIKIYKDNNKGLVGTTYELQNKKKTNKRNAEIDTIETFLNKIEFVYIDSINVFMPELIEKLTDDMINVQYDKARFSESKKALKDSYEKYINGLQSILDSFASSISDTFKVFKDNWTVEFKVPNNSSTVKDLISNDVTLSLNDNGSQNIISKGAGLQRLAAILLYFEMIKRLNKRKQAIFCVDEPDVFLHEGLQRKLKNFFDKNSTNMQIFFTTHSKVFINSYNMSNVFLLDATTEEQYSVRKEKNISVTKTFKIDITEDDGYKKICDHLGIENVTFDILENNNLLVEGECDKKYFTELGKYFNLEVPNIEVLYGADNAIKYLEFYDSFYNRSPDKPNIKLILDNDSKGRDIFQKVSGKTFLNIRVACCLLQNFEGTSNESLTGNNTNNEIEDLLYPEIVCYLINGILEKKNMNKIDSKKICGMIQTKSFSAKGILDLCEHKKNELNPETGAEFSLVSSSNATNRIKEGLAGLFSLQGNRKILKILDDCKIKYPYVESYLKELFNFDD